LNVALDYNEKEFNISDDVALDIILDLFSKNQNDFNSLIKSIIFLNYASLINSIKIVILGNSYCNKLCLFQA
jgi:hypothetical protein